MNSKERQFGIGETAVACRHRESGARGMAAPQVVILSFQFLGFLERLYKGIERIKTRRSHLDACGSA